MDPIPSQVAEITTHSDETIPKVANAIIAHLMSIGFQGEWSRFQATEMISQIQNEGILFRERVTG